MTDNAKREDRLVIRGGSMAREETKAIYRKASDALYEAGFGGQDQVKIIAALEVGGLRIVEVGERA